MRKILIGLAAFSLCISMAQARLLQITPAQLRTLGIRTVALRVAQSQVTASILGRVTAAPDARIPVAAPFAGTLKSLIRLEGERVRKGDALAVIASMDMSGGRLAAQQARYRAAKAAADRARTLVAEGIVPAGRAEEADAALATAQADLDALRGVAGAPTRNTQGGYQLLAPADGRIVSITVSTGDAVSAMQPVIILESGNDVWVEGAIPLEAIGRIAAGDGVSVDAMPGATGSVMAAGTAIDARTRSAMLRARLNGAAGLVQGQTVRLSVARKAQGGSFTLPRGAVADVKGQSTIFLARPGGFETVAVRVVGLGPQEATITGAVRAGEQAAVSGVSELKAVASQD